MADEDEKPRQPDARQIPQQPIDVTPRQQQDTVTPPPPPPSDDANR
jgi:hypothetical protein